jgi:OOP family OmpA-OmpF porin
MTTTRTLIFAAVAAALLPGMAIAQDSRNQGYLVDTYGNRVVTSALSGCWRTIDWTPARAVEPCDPVARTAEAPPVTIVAAAPPPAPAAAPLPAPAPVRMAPLSVNFSSDALFAFNKSDLKPEGKVMLDGFARQLRGAQYETIYVTGHTDRLGSEEYNQKLSERRANAVKDYLVGENVPASRISIDGKGETQPITLAGDCKSGKSVKIIDCLQPDRRVEVQMNGTRDVTASAF